jgi:hypothetical protein
MDCYLTKNNTNDSTLMHSDITASMYSPLRSFIFKNQTAVMDSVQKKCREFVRILRSLIVYDASDHFDSDID